MRCFRLSAHESRPRRGARPAVALVALCAALAVAVASAEASPPSPYVRALHGIDSKLRLAIETRPAALGEYLRTSEVVCALGERAEARTDASGALSDWSTLSQAVEGLDLPLSRATDAAFRAADVRLVVLRRKYSASWRSQPSRVRELVRGVAQARQGIRALRAAMERIAAAYPAWEERDCAGARQSIEAGAARIPAAVDRVSLGMLRLWRLQ